MSYPSAFKHSNWKFPVDEDNGGSNGKMEIPLYMEDFALPCLITGGLFIPSPSGSLLWLMKQIFHTGLGIDKQSTSYEFTSVALAKSNLPERGYCVSYLYHCIFPCLLDMFTKRWFGCVPNVSY